jgi:acyl carrier protein
MDKDILIEKFRDLLESEFDIERHNVSYDSLLYDDLDLDSIDAVDLMAWVVKLTGKRMSPEEFKNVRTVGDVIDALEKQLS